ncbi:MAG: sensor histidine kinase [Phycisphaeraceae bacterium]
MPIAAPAELLAELEKTQQRLEEVQQGLVRSHRLATLGTLASVIAHEYNNILTPVISYAQLALARPDDHDLLVKAVERALQGAERASQISTSMLGFSRDGAGAGDAYLPEVVEESLQCLARHPKKDGIELELDVPEVRVDMPALSLQQVLINLILNARKALRRRGGRLRIMGRVSGAWVRLTVADTGPGIPESIRGRLFEAFVTEPIEDANPLDAADTSPDADADGPHRLTSGNAPDKRKTGREQQGGTGLGLSICKQLVEDAGGTIRVESEPGKGASFHLDLPRAQAEAAAREEAA